MPNRRYFFNKSVKVFLSIVFLAIAGSIFLMEMDKAQKKVADLPSKTQVAHAQTGSQYLRGFAWNSDIGWISFNCLDYKTCSGGINNKKACSVDANCPSGTCDNTCTSFSNYKVIAGEDGLMSGYAWSPNVGWIYFGPNIDLTTPYGYGNVDVISAPENPKIWATFNESDGTVKGWAKILSFGDNGWIKMNTNKGQVVYDNATGDFSGWAWNATSTDAGIGWISFNCLNNGASFCEDTSDYKVYVHNESPTIEGMTAPNWTAQNACAALGRADIAVLSWVYRDFENSPASAYQVKVNKVVGGLETTVLDTGKCTGVDTCVSDCGLNTDGTKCTLNPAACMIGDGDACSYRVESGLDYASNYKWYLNVWDGRGKAALPSETDLDQFASSTFSITATHRYPVPEMAWFTPEASAGEQVNFLGRGTYYTTSDNVIGTECLFNDDCDVLWEAQDNGVEISNPNASSTMVVFKQVGIPMNVTMTLTDPEGYACSLNTTDIAEIKVKESLPDWTEVRGE